MNNKLIGFVITLMVCFSTQELSALAEKEPLSHVTMGDIKFPIVAETDELTIVKMGERYTATKKIGSDSRAAEYENCDIFDAQRDLLKRPLDAAAIYEKCLEALPEDHGLLRALGISYMVARNFNKSVSNFEKAVQQTPKDGVLHEQLADAYAMRGQMGEAEKHYGFAKKYMRQSESKRISKKLDRIQSFGFDNVVASYLLDYNGIQIRNGLVAALSYTDSVRRQDLDGDRKIYYLSEDNGDKDAVIDLNRLYKDLTAMNALNHMIKEDREAAQTEESKEKASINQLKKKVEEKSDEGILKEELAGAQHALINKLVRRETSYILAREEVQKKIDAQIRSVATQIAKERGIGRIAEKKPRETAIDLTTVISELINTQYDSKRQDIVTMIEGSRESIQVKNDIDPNEFFAAKPVSVAKKDQPSADDQTQPTRRSVSSMPDHGGSDASGETAANDRFIDHGFALEIDKGFVGWKALGRKNIFYEDDGEVLWFGQLSNWGKVKDAWTRGKYPIEWIAPDGRVFLRETMSPTMSRFQDLIYSKLSLVQFKDIPKGEWHVKVWRKDDLIHEAKFEIN